MRDVQHEEELGNLGLSRIIFRQEITSPPYPGTITTGDFRPTSTTSIEDVKSYTFLSDDGDQYTLHDMGSANDVTLYCVHCPAALQGRMLQQLA